MRQPGAAVQEPWQLIIWKARWLHRLDGRAKQMRMRLLRLLKPLKEEPTVVFLGEKLVKNATVQDFFRYALLGAPEIDNPCFYPISWGKLPLHNWGNVRLCS